MNYIHRCRPHGARRFVADAPRPRQTRVSDPTGTLTIQKKFQRDLRQRWDSVRKMIPDITARHLDHGKMIVQTMYTGTDPLKSFQSWLDEAMRQIVLGINGSWTLPYVRGAGDIGSQRAKALATGNTNPPISDRIPILQTLAITELQGIIDAVSQQAARVFANGSLTSKSATKVAREIQAIIDDTGKRRSDMLANFILVRTHSIATLDAFRAANVLFVGTIPERIVSPSPIRDAETKSGLPTTASRRGPGLVEVYDAKAKKKKKVPKNLVEVLTAGDERVCQDCQDISDEGPYSLDEAEMMIPAHPRCRCAFVPWHDERFAGVRDEKWNEADHPRVPAGSSEGGQFGTKGDEPSIDVISPVPEKKPKKTAKVEDFEKAKISFSGEPAQKFVEKWNAQIGVDPEEFKTAFMGGVPSTMRISLDEGEEFRVTGELLDDDGDRIGNYTRQINVNKKSAYSEYFKLDDESQGGDIGKKMLAGNVAMYEQLGIEKVKVTANIDVGGYAWAKYGYVPTDAAWASLRSRLERGLGGSSSSRSSRGPNSVEADDWSMLGDSQQEEVRDAWKRDTHASYVDSEVQNWRDNGGAKDEAKQELAQDFTNNQVTSSDIPKWINEAIDGAREYREQREQPPIPYTNRQIYDAMELTFESRNGDGEDDPDIDWDDNMLKTPEGYDPAQGTLPGIEPEDPSARMTDDMRDRLVKRMTEAFDKQAEDNADDIDPPSYLAEGVEDYQAESWSGMSDRERLQHAVNFDMAHIEIEPDEDDEDAELDLEEKPPTPGEDPLITAARSSDPKSLWKIADTARGKQLLLGDAWRGVLDLKDPESMKRFREYVGRVKKRV